VYGQFGIVNQWLSFGADIPIGWWADFRDPNVTTATNQNKFVMGDINLNFKSELVRTKYFGLALLPFITIPTGYGKEFFGNGNVTDGGSVIAEVKPLSIWSVSLNAGIQGREKFIFRDIEKSNQLLLGLGTAVQIIDPVSLAAEIVSSTRLSGPFSEEKESPVEARAGVKWMIGKSGFLASLGGGAGIVRGSGAPSYRAFAGLSFSPRRMEKEKMQEVVQSNFISIKDAFFCGGFFIGNEWIVTAAHCLKNSELQASNKDKESIGVAINSYNLNNIKILDTRNVVEMIEHEGFDYANKYKDWLNTSDLKLRNKSDDIALLRINLLDKELPKNTLSLNNNSQLINPGNKVIMLGWGDLGLTWLTK